jgi:hypothetical protein
MSNRPVLLSSTRPAQVDILGPLRVRPNVRTSCPWPAEPSRTKDGPLKPAFPKVASTCPSIRCGFVTNLSAQHTRRGASVQIICMQAPNRGRGGWGRMFTCPHRCVEPPHHHQHLGAEAGGVRAVQCSRASEHLVPQIQSHRRSDLHAGQAEAEPITYIAGRWLASDKDSARARGSDSDGFSRRRRRRKRNLKRVDGMEFIHHPYKPSSFF